MTPPIFLSIYVAGFLFAAAIRLWYTQEYRRRLKQTGWMPVLDTWLVYLPAIGFFFVPAFYILTPFLAFADYTLPGWAGWGGSVLFAGALLLLWRSHADLGANFTPVASVQQGQLLVSTGVYRHIRHPMYAAHFFWAFAQPLLLWNWIAGFALLLTFIPLYVVRVPVEERLLADKFGEGYGEYMERTGRIIPKFSRNETR
jgi:protein-S-isoprenylcysteine O-methyltransferase Ste14